MLINHFLAFDSVSKLRHNFSYKGYWRGHVPFPCVKGVGVEFWRFFFICLRQQSQTPRQARIDAPGALHHIICRGIDRRNIFKDNMRHKKNTVTLWRKTSAVPLILNIGQKLIVDQLLSLKD